MKNLLIITMLAFTACAPKEQRLTDTSSIYDDYICAEEVAEDANRALNFCIQYQATESYCTKQVLEQFCERVQQ